MNATREKSAVSEVCNICRKFHSLGTWYSNCCASCWCINQPYFDCVAIQFKDKKSMPKCSEEFTVIEARNAFIYEGMSPFRSCESYEVRSVQVGALGGLKQEELVRVFDHVWKYGGKL